MANRSGKKIDTTMLSIARAAERGIMHRDYLAHCFRYTHIIHYLNQQNKFTWAQILDVGCGRQAPLARTMYSRMKFPIETDLGCYVGVDITQIDDEFFPKDGHFRMALYPKMDFADDINWDAEDYFDVETCFEMVEHIEPDHALRTLQKMHLYLKPEGRAFISTPVYSKRLGAAGNHVNEMSYEAMAWMLRMAGFEIEQVFGTFASQRDIRPALPSEWADLYDEIGAYYDPELFATFMAPLFPEQSRNCLWRVTKGVPLFPVEDITWEILAGPEHGSSAEWKTFLENLQQRQTPKKTKKVRQLRGG